MEAEPLLVDEHEDPEAAERAEEAWREVEAAAAAGDWEAIGIDPPEAPKRWERSSIEELMRDG